MKILVKAIAGSHLFGTNTPSSDQDFKGIFLPSANEILLGKFDQTIHQSTNSAVGQKNTKDDVDVEFYSLDKFLKMLYQGQTVAWELLFTPDHMILEKHPLWDDICAAAPKLVNKKVDAFIGYCAQQAHKYGVRGSRMETMEKTIALFKQYPEWKKLGEIDYSPLLELKHVEQLDKYFKDDSFKVLSICGKKFEDRTKLSFVIPPLEKYYEDYGERSRKAKENQGIDWKSLSHAVRVCMQASSLLNTGKIELPMAACNTELLKEIKAGKLSFETVAIFIEEYQDQLLRDQASSSLPDEPNLSTFQDIQKRIYGMVIRGEV